MTDVDVLLSKAKKLTKALHEHERTGIRLAEDRREAVRELRAQGLTLSIIALGVGLTEARVWHLCRDPAKQSEESPE